VNLTHSTDADDRSPAWDFTGGKITWARAVVNGGHTGPFDIWRMSWTGREPTNLTPNTASDDVEPAWAPRSAEIAFASNRTTASGRTAGATYGIWLMNASTGEVERRIASDGRSPNWSPSGNLITFIRGGDVWTVHANGKGLQQLTHESPHVDDKPVFSPDGKKIAFETGRLGGAVPPLGTGLAIMNADGTGRSAVLSDPQFRGQSEPDWKPGCSVQPHLEQGHLVIDGTAGPDLICFSKQPTTVFGGGGNDSIYGGGANNVIHAGGGDDIVLGAKGDDTIYGDAGSDYLEADDGNDHVVGGPGNDTLLGGDGSDVLSDAGPTSGHDTVSGGPGHDVCIVDSKRIDHTALCESIQFRLLW
jgi:dipeptidyl aminopeptidase/acylaminoacyl peptidase